MRNFYTKELLYREIAMLRKKMGITAACYPINSISLCDSRDDIIIGYHKFVTEGLKGMLLTSDGLNAILLDAEQLPEEQNFFCAHELMHSVLHRDLGLSNFSCFDKVRPQQNPSIEWQANEGAAEFLVPYKLFIPDFWNLYSQFCSRRGGCSCIRTRLAEKYHVSDVVIRNRIDNLRYEIDQFTIGIAIDNLSLLSRRKQDQLGIIPIDYNAICDYG